MTATSFQYDCVDIVARAPVVIGHGRPGKCKSHGEHAANEFERVLDCVGVDEGEDGRGILRNTERKTDTIERKS